MRTPNARAARFVALAVMVAASALGGAPAAAQSVAPGASDSGEPIYLNLVWHQHQPLYYKDESGVYTRPWARVHATKDYYDMAAMLERHPGVKVSFNLTPVLLRQLADFASGAKDRYMELAEKPAASLTPDERRFILERFFDANYRNIIGRFPRYAQLLAKRGGATAAELDAALGSFTERDFRDLQVWFNLAWFDPSFLEREPLASLVAKGGDFAEADKEVLFSEARRIAGEIVPLHKRLQDEGRIEVTTTPYAHPILPLIFNSDLTKRADPTGAAPPRFSWPNDAIAQLDKSAVEYEAAFGRPVRGLWPGEGAVSQDTVRITARAGFSWMATGEQVLAKSLGIGSFSRDGKDTVREPDALYRPYYVQDGDYRMAVFFRDLRLSDLIGFEYSGMDPRAAAADFVARIEAIRKELRDLGAAGPHIVSVILDGENAWENYPGDGIAFLDAFYSALESSATIRTTTPSEYLDLYPEQRSLERLAEGCWFTPDYSTWIGEPEENLAWEYLGRVREHLAKYDVYKQRKTTPERLAAAKDAMYLAEGSDWFWWYGDDQDSGVDTYFDEGFRALLKQVYTALGDEPPAFLDAPIIPRRSVEPSRAYEPGKGFSPTADGIETPGEWDSAGLVVSPGGVQASSRELPGSIRYGFAGENLLVKIDARIPWADYPQGSTLAVYLGVEKGKGSPFSLHGTALGYNALAAFEVSLADGKLRQAGTGADGAWKSLAAPASPGAVAGLGRAFAEISVPLAVLGTISPGDRIVLSVYTAQPVLSPGGEGAVEGWRESAPLPASGPLAAMVPDLLSLDPVLSIADPRGDDRGPGTYMYPTDTVFAPGVFDIVKFEVGQNEEFVAFKFTVAGPIDNVWNSGIGLSVQTFDIYIDVDPGKGSGARSLLEGRNAALPVGYGWERALWVEGWNQKLFTADAEGLPREIPGTVRVVVDPARRSVGITVPKAALGLGRNASEWGYAAVVLSQEGYPAPGVRRVRDVQQGAATQWRLGGAPADANHTRILDLALPQEAAPDQAGLLGKYPSLSAPRDKSGRFLPDEVGTVPVVSSGQ